MNNKQDLERALRSGGMSRRDVLSSATALGISAAVATTMFERSARAAPQKGGHLRAGLAGGSTSDTLDGATHSDTFMQMFGSGMLYNTLTEVRASGELGPELAESWEASADAATWTFDLRKGVTWHNGKDFEAQDVIESIQHHMGEDSKSAAKPIVAPVETITADGKHRVIFKLKSGNADFPYLMSDYHLLMYPAGQMEESLRSGNGTGGYIMESFEPGVRGLAKRNPNYFKSDRAHFDSVELIGIADAAARMSALNTGEVDVINRVDLKTIRMMERNKDIEIFEVTGNQHFTFPMITQQAPFDNNDLRLALKYAVDRDELVKKILRGHGLIGNDHPIGPANQFFAKELEQRSYDPDKAKFHWKKAGVGDAVLDLSAADAAFPGAVDAAVLYKEHAAKAGININVIREPNDGYWSNVWMKKAWCACYWSGRATEDWMFGTAYERGVPWNDTFWEHARFNELLIKARAELDSAKRRQMYLEMQTIVRDEGGVVVPMYANYVDAASRKLAHEEQIGNNWQLDGVRIAERWWFA